MTLSHLLLVHDTDTEITRNVGSNLVDKIPLGYGQIKSPLATNT